MFCYVFLKILYQEQIRGYPSLRHVKLGCQLFGLAGYYALVLRSDRNQSSVMIGSTSTESTLKVNIFTIIILLIYTFERNAFSIFWEWKTEGNIHKTIITHLSGCLNLFACYSGFETLIIYIITLFSITWYKLDLAFFYLDGVLVTLF